MKKGEQGHVETSSVGSSDAAGTDGGRHSDRASFRPADPARILMVTGITTGQALPGRFSFSTTSDK
jgi:hypothetical protein